MSCEVRLEDKRMASGLIGNEVPLTGLRVRVPCPPLKASLAAGFFVSCFKSVFILWSCGIIGRSQQRRAGVC